MQALRNPLLAVGLLLIALGMGNWYTGWDKATEYRSLLSAEDSPAAEEDLSDFRFLTGRTNAALLARIHPDSDDFAFVARKLEFYELIQHGGRALILAGIFLVSIALTRLWRGRSPRQRPDHGLPAARSV